MKPVWLECGGKSPNLVFGDCADLEGAADLAAMKLVFNQGQVCSSNSRLLVERGIKDAFLSMLVDRVRKIQPGDPLDPASKMGALVDQTHTKRVLGYIELGRQSADLLVGGSQRVINNSDCFVEPTIFDNVDPDAVIAQEEIFGPVLSAIPFDDEDQAIEIANGTIYGLAASIWTDNLSRAHRVARRLRAGTVSVNQIDAISPHTPFGGVKQSGTGRDLSLHSFDKYTALKTTWLRY
jgi:gamma-glutamyl-gamma-aminobutyraldehyde dehydrogenase